MSDIHERFEKFNEEHCKWDRIPEPERLHPSRMLCGLMKVAALMKNPAEFDLCAEHDEVYLASEEDLVPLTDDDIVYLLRCGVCWDNSNDCLHKYT